MKTTRRDVLKVGLSGLGVLSLSTSVPSFLSQFAFAETATASPVASDNILVVVQLSGGNDGLNTVIPIGNDDYVKARPNIAIKDRHHRLGDNFALNPGLKDFKDLFDDAKLAVINGCGYPNPNRSHFRSMEIWHTANPSDTYEPTGWLGHYVDHMVRGTSSLMSAVNIGPELPLALVAEKTTVPSIQSIDDFRIRTDPNVPQDAKIKEQIIRELNAARESTPALQYLSRQATNAIVEADQIRKVTSAYKPDVEYPYGLGQQLKLIAQIISGNFGTRIFYCQSGGFDTHASQTGQHERILSNVASAIRAFHKDMEAKGLGNKVTVMCFSEFGRRVNQNSSAGTDHGTAGPMFVSGAAVKPGVYGAYPSLTDLDNGDLKYTTDFRRVYATLLEKWLNADSAALLKNKFEPLAFL
ncbi:MAG TPA: DUF1501 domain-containing protein [Tepidisphaeraceae bacterium]|jgi:uncharacterized protein (DUF1501 family)